MTVASPAGEPSGPPDARKLFLQPQRESSNRRLAQLSLAALGIVFGDIATSPIYALRECFHGQYGIAVSQANILGVLSLMFWSLVMIVGLKYLVFVFQASNHGEGGVIALTALVRGKGSRREGPKRSGILLLGLFAACLLYGDGMITPAISVLSAVEGMSDIAPGLTGLVIPATIAILCGLFMLQRHGTAKVGRLFGPVILLWLGLLAVLGVAHILANPQVIQALAPWHGVQFLLANKGHGFLVLGAVFLVVTGTEALYADMGHFGARPIRLTWFLLVFPALVLNYFGQGAMLLAHPEIAARSFYAMVPAWAMIPVVVLATLATIIASQAVISGAFSLTRQALQMGYLPRMIVRHTSVGQIGQVYIAPVNWMLALCTIGLVLGFRTSSHLAAAYGVAVTSTMLITSVLFWAVATKRWHWPAWVSGSLLCLFLAIDLPFFLANISKVFHGAWFPLLIGAVFFTVMLTWERGRHVLGAQLDGLSLPLSQLQEEIRNNPPTRVSGQAVFLSSRPHVAPSALIKNIRHNKVIHDLTVLLHFMPVDVPRVPTFKKVELEKLGEGMFRVQTRYGFMEQPNALSALALARYEGLPIDTNTASFFLGRERLYLGKVPRMNRLRAHLFRFMSRNATDTAFFYGIPPDQIVEVGVRIHL